MNKLTREQLIKKNKELEKELVLKNRQLEIEEALERIRSRSMAMHKSDELMEVIQLVYEQLVRLNIKINSTNFCLNYKESDDFTFWTAIPGRPYPTKFFIPYFDHPWFIRFKEAKKKRLPFTADRYSFEEKNRFWIHFFDHAPTVTDERKKFILSGPGLAVSQVYMNTISLIITNYEGIPFSDEENAVFKRIGEVFEQTYTRFLDLQKAEEQAREAQIEAALERVRSRTMGMQKSEELTEVIAHINAEITNLGIRSDNTAIITEINLTENLGSICMWFSIPGKTYSNKFYLPFTQHPMFYRLLEARKKKKEFYTEFYSKEERIRYLKIAFEESDLKLLPDERKEYLLNAPAWTRTVTLQKNSGLVLQRYSNEAFSDKDNAVAIRFGRVFEQTYTRFLDLQKAEQQLREAVKQASLDRVRGEIASMRTKDDLDRITPLIWKELVALGVPFIRCGVFIMDEEKKVVHSYLSTPDGNSLAAFEMTFDEEGIAKAIIEHWEKKKIYTDFWDKKQFLDFMKNLIDRGKVDKPESYQGSVPPPESLYLNFVPIKQGMLYVGNTSALVQEELELVMSLAESFSIAYARYDDFKQLEEAKTKTELTLKDLKSTQAQLIQSEKMASLGELTAGIAHEIQNPLNFVNNFSEISNELLHELKEELATGNMQLVTELADDILQNLEKINHHGKRAADIVKGMLQHSRTSNGVKEPTDINALADEYLRLSYHGLRAKDKSLPYGQAGFNADFKTNFDPTLPKINVIPQDIGRVLLNLINNAFYAANERSKKGEEGYKPTVSISTAKAGDKLEIKVADNGNGIPENIKEKIFQPFFTTKPTGQGTGLGLSLAYDIVKAHGGELKVETKEARPDDRVGRGEGSEFIIQLPIV